MNALTIIEPQSNVSAYRESTEAADICKAIVVATASNIQGRKYVAVEGWMAIARAHGCSAGARDVEKVDGGVRAIGEVRRMSDGIVIATAEGFVGEDEETWYGGQNKYGKVLPKRADYAIRAMAQTRAISRACRSAFAHVVVMMNAGLATTPAEEVPFEGFDRSTGEVIDNRPPHVEVMPPDEPKRKPVKLDGPYTSKTQLWAAVRTFDRELRSIGDIDSLDAFVTSEDSKALLDQCERDFPFLVHGGEGSPDEYEPLYGLIAKLRSDLEAAEHTERYRNSPIAAG